VLRSVNSDSDKNEIEMEVWFPGLFRKNFATKCRGKPKLRILCFPPAGCAEDLFSTEGTGTRHEKSPLLEWARKHSAEVLAVQYPGRTTRKKESCFESIRELVDSLHGVLKEYCDDDVPYVVVAHSVGTWIAYELLRRMRQDAIGGGGRKKMFKMPEHCFLSSFPPPTIPDAERPWRVNKDLDEEQFKDECRRWNVNEVVFKFWDIYHPLLRSDFTLFDQFKHEGEASKFDWSATIFYGKDDGMITKEMCEGWKDMTKGTPKTVEVEGHHLFPLEKVPKAAWLGEVAKELDDVMEYVELKLEYAGM